MGQATDALSDAMREFFRVAETYLTVESRIKGLEFKPKKEDVILSTAAKSGTTWCQQICHGLRSGGDMSFDEMCLVFPCLEMALDYGYEDLQAEQPYLPRMYKTHFWYPNCPKGAGKYIVMVRRPTDTALSFFHYFENWIFRSGDLSLEEFVGSFYLQRGKPEDIMDNASQVENIVSWYPHRKDDNVLWLHYEDLQQDVRECVRLIAEFLDIGSRDEKLQDLVARQADIEFMKKHASKFDEHPLKLSRNEIAGLPRDAGFHGNSGKVRSGRVRPADTALPEDLLSKIQQEFKRVVTPETGYETYDALREGINKELGRKFV